jgi:SAM-dependent methyltransferase
MSLMANALPTANQPGRAAITTRQQATWASGDFAVVARTIQIRGAVGSPGRVVGLDMTPAMLDRSCGHVAEASADNIELREGLMEALPFPDRSFDAVVSNGVLNLSTRKSRALAEMLRVLRPGAGGPRRARAHRHLARGDYERPDGAGALTGRSTGGASAEEEALQRRGFEAVATADRRPFGIATRCFRRSSCTSFAVCSQANATRTSCTPWSSPAAGRSRRRSTNVN